MVLEERNAFNNPWNTLQQPTHASQGLPDSFRSFLAALDQGWQVRAPAQVLAAAQGAGRTYRFELVHPMDAQARRIDVQAAPAIEQFLEQNNIPLEEDNERGERSEIG